MTLVARKHVFGDLEPYMCTYGDCVRPDKTYGERRIWYVLSKHVLGLADDGFCHARALLLSYSRFNLPKPSSL